MSFESPSQDKLKLYWYGVFQLNFNNVLYYWTSLPDVSARLRMNELAYNFLAPLTMQIAYWNLSWLYLSYEGTTQDIGIWSKIGNRLWKSTQLFLILIQSFSDTKIFNNRCVPSRPPTVNKHINHVFLERLLTIHVGRQNWKMLKSGERPILLKMRPVSC